MIKEVEKQDFWQVIRRICIIAVVMIHAPAGSVYESGSVDYTGWLTMRQFVNFPVSIFIFLSGYFFNLRKFQIYKYTYIKERVVKRLAIPFLLWSLFYTFASVFKDVVINEELDISKYIFRLISGQASIQLYYILVLIQLLLLTPILLKIRNEKPNIYKYLWLITPLYLILNYGRLLAGNQMFPLYGTLFFAWFLFYYLGLNARLYSKKLLYFVHKYGKLQYLFLTIVLSLLESFLIVSKSSNTILASTQLKFGSILYSIFLLLSMFKLSQKPIIQNKLISTLIELGNNSYGIYFAHVFVSIIINSLLSKFSLNHNYFSYFFLSFVLTILITYWAIKIVKMVLNKINLSKLLKYLGL